MSPKTGRYKDVNTHKVANLFVDMLPPEVAVEVKGEPGPDGKIEEYRYGYQALNPKYVEQLAEELTAVVADVVAQLINAGSERDAVMERLIGPVTAELKEWVPDAGYIYEAIRR